MTGRSKGKLEAGWNKAAGVEGDPWPIGIKLKDCTVEAEAVHAALRRMKSMPVCSPVLDFERVEIEGEFDLSDASGPHGGPLGALLFRDCVFRDRINLRSAHLQRLVLSGSQFPELMARDSQIEGSLDLTNVGPLTGDKDERCVVFLDRARVDGSVYAGKVRLRAPESGPDASAALSLDLAEINGSVYLDAEASLRGQMCLQNAHVRGDVTLSSATIETADTTPLDMRGVQIDGKCVIDGGVLRPGKENDALDAADASFAGGMMVQNGCRIEGRVCLINARVRGDLWLTDTTVEGESREALQIQRVRIDGLFILRNCTLNLKSRTTGKQAIDALNGQFPGGVRLENCAFSGEAAVTLARAQFGALDVEGCVMDGTLDLNESRCVGSVKIGVGGLRTTEVKALNVQLAEIEGALLVRAVFLDTPAAAGAVPTVSIMADGVRVGGDVRLSGQTSTGVRLHGAHVRGEVQFGDRNDDLRFITGIGKAAEESLKLDLSDAVLDRGLEVAKLTQGLGRATIRDWLSDLITIRAAPLPFYDDAHLVVGEIDVPAASGDADPERTRWIVAGLASRPDGSGGVKDYGVRILGGESAPIHDLNAVQRPRMKTPELAWSYLAFFCDSAWGKDGAFTLVSAGRGLEDEQWRRLHEALDEEHLRVASERGATVAEVVSGARVSRDGDAWLISALVAHGEAIFRAVFSVKPDGQIEMIEDTPLVLIDAAFRVDYRGGFRLPPPTMEIEAVFAAPGLNGVFRPDEADAWRPLMCSALASHPVTAEFLSTHIQKATRPNLVQVNLSGAHLGSLKDDHGRAWDGLKVFRLDLTALSLDRIYFEAPETHGPEGVRHEPGARGRDRSEGGREDARSSSPFTGKRPVWAGHWRDFGVEVQSRLRWLAHQFGAGDSGLSGYNPEPYLRISQALARAGQLEAARRVDSESRTLQLQAARHSARVKAAALTEGGGPEDAATVVAAKALLFMLPVVVAVYLALYVVGLLYPALWTFDVRDRIPDIYLVALGIGYLGLIVWQRRLAVLVLRSAIALVKGVPRGLWLLSRAAAFRLGGAILYWGGGLLCLVSDYFMSLKRAIAVTIAFYLFGVAVTAAASQAELLVLEVPPVASVAYSPDAEGVPRYGVPLLESTASPAPPVSCAAVIDVWVYPLDMMTPLALGQKEKCGFQRPPLEKSVARLDVSDAARTSLEKTAIGASTVLVGALRIAKPFYELLGWLVVTMLIVTATNVFRRNGGAA